MVKRIPLVHLPWTIWLIIILVLSFIPGNRLPEVKFNWLEIDTLVHVIMYAALTFLMLIGFYHSKNELIIKTIVFILVSNVLIGFFVEEIQGSYIEKRFFSWRDVLANTIGSGLSLLAYLFYKKKGYNLVRFLQ